MKPNSELWTTNIFLKSKFPQEIIDIIGNIFRKDMEYHRSGNGKYLWMIIKNEIEKKNTQIEKPLPIPSYSTICTYLKKFHQEQYCIRHKRKALHKLHNGVLKFHGLQYFCLELSKRENIMVLVKEIPGSSSIVDVFEEGSDVSYKALAVAEKKSSINPDTLQHEMKNAIRDYEAKEKSVKATEGKRKVSMKKVHRPVTPAYIDFPMVDTEIIENNETLKVPPPGESEK